DKSQTHCRTFLQQFPADGRAAQVMFLSAENELLAERLSEAADGYRLLLSRFPDCAHASKARYRLGTVLYRLERFDEAAEVLQQVADEAKRDETLRFALFALGDMCFRRSEWKRAERYLSDYLQSGLRVASADDALLKLGLALQRQGDYAEALRAYDRLLAEFADSPHRVQALFERGQALVALGRLDEGREAFTQVLAAGDDTAFAPHATNHLAAIAMQQNQPQTAAQLLGRLVDGDRDATDRAESLFKQGQAWFAAGKLDEAEGAFRGFLDRYPGHTQTAEALARLAITLSRLERYADALQSIKRIADEFAGKLPPALEASVKYEEAWCLQQTGQTERAADTYRALLAGDVSGDVRIHALLELAALEAETHRYAQAADLLRQLGQAAADPSVVMPSDVRAQQIYRLGVCEFEMGRLAAAADLFNEFITLFPGSPLIGSASFFCGEAQYQMGKYGQAVGNLTRVIEDYSEDPVFAPSLLRLGQCLTELKRWPRAEEVFAEYVKRFGESDQWYQAQFGLGWARENQGRPDEAIRAYREVIDRHQGPTAARAQFQVGECLFAKKEYEDAARELLKVDILYAYPQWSAAALYEAGRCFEKLAKLVEARAQFDAVTSRFGDTRWAGMASQRLEALSGGGVPGR
ncbi:MAG: tetratricopeptide repeat protein, partial [Planctomycetes bacterium]|nr:tetratricopeptide repeat protein [Planctomycetota bacterium]